VKKMWKTLAATTTVVSMAFGGVALSSLSASAATDPGSTSDADGGTVDSAPASVPTSTETDAAATDLEPGGAASETPSPAPSVEGDDGEIATAPVSDGPVDGANDESSPVGVDEDVATPGAEEAVAPAAQDEVVAAALATPTITSPSDGSSLEVTGTEGATPGDVPVAFAGSGQAGALVTLVFVRDDAAADVSSEPDATTTVGADGTWSVTVGLETGSWATTATQTAVDAGGLPTGDASPASEAVRFEAIAQVLPWASVEPPYDTTYVASDVDGRSVAQVPVYGNAGSIFSVEITVISADGTQVFDTYSTPTSSTGAYYEVVPLPVGEWRVSVQQVSFSFPTHPEIKTMTSTPTVSPVIRVLPVGSADAAPPVITSPLDGAVVNGTPADVDAPPLTIEGTGTPGYTVFVSGTTTTGAGYPRDVYFAEDLIVGADGRWTTTTNRLPFDTYTLTAFQVATGVVNATYSLGSDPVTVDLRGPVAAAAPTSPVAVAGSTGATSLAYTGSSESAPLAGLAGMLLVGLGAAAVVVSRRRASRG
jgi:hypothetical protein